MQENKDSELFPAQETVGLGELKAVAEVMGSGVLSHYRGNAGPMFMGGPKVQEFEERLARKMGVEHAIAVNSATSGLHVACAAIFLDEEDEVIVTPWSMSCSASAPALFGAKVVFADIDPDYYCLTLESVKAVATENTRAVIAVSLFGQVFDPKIKEWADENDIVVIEDAAQAIGSTYPSPEGNKQAGTLGDLGVFSFTQGKHLTAGEGGAIITDNKALAQRCRLIRNHAEAVSNDMQGKSTDWGFYPSLLGFNMRMTEIQAAIMIRQLGKLDRFVELRVSNAMKLYTILHKHREIFTTPKVRPGCRHSYYAFAFQVDTDILDVKKFVTVLNSLLPGEKGRPDKTHFGLGYITPLYYFPFFQSLLSMKPELPVVEQLHLQTVVTTIIGLPLNDLQWKQVENAVYVAIDSSRKGGAA